MSAWILGALAILLALPVLAQDWQIGLARAKITPEEPIRMAGYASRTKPSENVIAPCRLSAGCSDAPRPISAID